MGNKGGVEGVNGCGMNCRKQAKKHNCTIFMHDELTPSVARLAISSSPPDELYSGVAVSVGGLVTAKRTVCGYGEYPPPDHEYF